VFISGETLVKKLRLYEPMTEQPKVLLLLCTQFFVFVFLLHFEELFLSLLKLNPVVFY
jgi:hypothetical protein